MEKGWSAAMEVAQEKTTPQKACPPTSQAMNLVGGK